MEKTAITVSEAGKRFGKTEALRDLSLTIAPGELFFLLGPSGCGKTTLLRALAGFTPLDTGTIHLNETDITPLPPEKRRIGMVFQSYALWPHLSVAENITFGLEILKLSRKEQQTRLAETLEWVQLTGLENRKPGELSGGQQQRVALARALITRPRCLLLDEPLSNLDTQLRLTMRNEIRRLCKMAGITAVYVTHDQKEALAAADRLAVMRAGQIEQVGPPQTLYRSPANRFVAAFLGELNTFTLAGNIYHLRPEAIRLTPLDADVTQTSEERRAVITDSEYLGDTILYRLARKTTGETLTVSHSNPREFLAPGTNVSFDFCEADALHLEKED